MSDTPSALGELIARFEAEVLFLTDDQLDRPQRDEAWTAREVIGHLVLTVRQYDDKLRGLVARYPQGLPARAGPHKTNFFARMLLKMLPNVGRKFKAPKIFDPRRSDERFTPDTLIESHRALKATGKELERLHLSHKKFGTPVSPLLRMRAGDAVPVQIEHGKRHLGQILRAAGVAVE